MNVTPPPPRRLFVALLLLRHAGGVRGRVLLVQRGRCYFSDKARAAAAAGATAVIVYNDKQVCRGVCRCVCVCVLQREKTRSEDWPPYGCHSVRAHLKPVSPRFKGLCIR